MAAAAIIFALVVLVRSELTPDRDGSSAGASEQSTPRTSVLPRFVTPTPRPTPHPTPAAESSPAPAITPTETPAPATPTPPTYSLLGLVTDTDGKPVPKATVRATYQVAGSQQSVNAASDDKGQFTLAGIRTEELDVVIVEALGYARNVVEKLRLPLPDRIEIALTPLAGLDIIVQQVDHNIPGPRANYEGDADFTLLQERSAADTSPTLGISEAMLGQPRFVPVAQKHVRIQEGSLRVEELEPGTYKAAIITPKHQAAESLPFQILGAHRTQTTITLGLSYPVSGNVVADGDAHPVAQAQVLLRPSTDVAAPFELAALSDAQGRFTIPAVPPNRYLLFAGAPGFTTKTLEAFDVTQEGPPRETSITLTQQKPQIRVTVVDSDGKPLAKTRLVLMMTSPVTRTNFSSTDDAGTKTFENVSPGTYTLAATAPVDRTRQKTTQLTLTDGETTDILLAFPRTTHVQGHARKDGKAYHGLLAFTLRGSINLQTMTKSDETGGYMVELEPGEYTVGTPEQPNAQVVIIRPNQPGNTDVEVK
jgi:hypothetical protein